MNKANPPLNAARICFGSSRLEINAFMKRDYNEKIFRIMKRL